MRAPSELSWAALLFCCTAVSLTTSVAVALAFHQLHKPREKGARTDKNVATPRTQLAEEGSEEREDAATVSGDAKTASAGPLASIEALLSSVEELLASTSSPAPDDAQESPQSGSDSLHDADNKSLLHEEPQLSAKALLASVEAILANAEAPKTEETEAPKESEKPQELPVDVPPEHRVDTYFSPEHIATFDHRDIFRGRSNVSAVIDAIRPYLEKFFRESAWVDANPHTGNVMILKTNPRLSGRYNNEPADSDTEDDEDTDSIASLDASIAQQWRLPPCVDPTGDAQVVVYPGVDSRTFSPEKIINVDTNADNERRPGSHTSNDDRKLEKKNVVVLPGALILGGVFDVSEGSIFIGKHARVEPNTYIKGPCIIGNHSTVRSGAYLGGDMIVGNHVLLRGELKNALVMDHTEISPSGNVGDAICGTNHRVLGPQDEQNRV